MESLTGFRESVFFVDSRTSYPCYQCLNMGEYKKMRTLISINHHYERTRKVSKEKQNQRRLLFLIGRLIRETNWLEIIRSHMPRRGIISNWVLNAWMTALEVRHLRTWKAPIKTEQILLCSGKTIHFSSTACYLIIMILWYWGTQTFHSIKDSQICNSIKARTRWTTFSDIILSRFLINVSSSFHWS